MTKKQWPPPEGFGDKVRRLARELKLDNPTIAKAIGVHEVTVSRIFAGQIPRGVTLVKLADLLQVTPGWLVEEEEPNPGRPPVQQEPNPKGIPVTPKRRAKEG